MFERQLHKALKGRIYGSVHVSKSKYFCSLFISVIALKTPNSDLRQWSHAIVSRGRLTVDQNFKKIPVEYTNAVDL